MGIKDDYPTKDLELAENEDLIIRGFLGLFVFGLLGPLPLVDLYCGLHEIGKIFQLDLQVIVF
jgi:hypothetical protein